MKRLLWLLVAYTLLISQAIYMWWKDRVLFHWLLGWLRILWSVIHQLIWFESWAELVRGLRAIRYRHERDKWLRTH